VANPSAISLYFLSQAAREHVSVVLSGEGADELFGGYRVYREPFDLDRVRRLPRPARALAARLGSSKINFRGRNYLRRASTVLNDRYFGGGYGTFTPSEVRRLLRAAKVQDHFQPGHSLATSNQDFEGLPESRRMQLIDINYWLDGDILATADRMSMAHSLELRVPFLDIKVAREGARIPESLKYRDGTTKWLLRRAFRGRLPQTTETRQKLGFPTPLRRWIAEDPDTMLVPIRRSARLADLVDMTYVEELALMHATGQIDASRRLLLLMMLACWLDAFMDGDVTKPPSGR
jgi:asparagine synthase (glutamine-hydrolysing)